MTRSSDEQVVNKVVSLGKALVDMMVGMVKANEYLNRADPEPPEDAQTGEFTAVRHYGYIAVFDGQECVMKLSYVDADQLVTEISDELYQETEINANS